MLLSLCVLGAFACAFPFRFLARAEPPSSPEGRIVFALLLVRLSVQFVAAPRRFFWTKSVNHRDTKTWSGFIKSVAASVSEVEVFPLAHARSYVRVLGYSVRQTALARLAATKAGRDLACRPKPCAKTGAFLWR